MYAATKAYHLHRVRMRLNVPQVILTGGAIPSLRTRSRASAFSSSVRNHAAVVYGPSGKTKYVAIPTGNVMQPQMMYSHLHPAMPWTPFKFLYTAAWRYPEKVVPNTALACKMVRTKKESYEGQVSYL